ncbi:carboxypeptidase-like regulatory domain-containing protein [Mucilaginibacter lappiensis]|uniref:carboxypeptidase-like regulatory domain-containing protein n=1 Tax=Mucilaginibacter lappiensis TaxID=354630 RepID=UPI003D261A48
MITNRPKLLMRKTRPGMLLLLLLCIFTYSNAQTTNAIKGVVKDAQGGPLPGVTVQVKGTDRSTATAVSGAFTINAAKGSVLQFRFIGFELKEITVGDETAQPMRIPKRYLKTIYPMPITGIISMILRLCLVTRLMKLR